MKKNFTTLFCGLVTCSRSQGIIGIEWAGHNRARSIRHKNSFDTGFDISHHRHWGLFARLLAGTVLFDRFDPGLPRKRLPAYDART